MASRKFERITDKRVETVRFVIDFDQSAAYVIWDKVVRGLFVRIGRHKVTWVFQKQYRTRGKRGTTFRRLGFFPAMGVIAARKAALMYAGQIAAGKPMPGLRDAVTLDQALVEYDRHLRDQSKQRGKPATWAGNVASFARLHLSPAFGRWTLAELSASPALVRDFHVGVTKEAGPGAADHCCRIIAALYRYMAKLDRSLPPQSPCSAVKYHGYTPSTADSPSSNSPNGDVRLIVCRRSIMPTIGFVCCRVLGRVKRQGSSGPMSIRANALSPSATRSPEPTS